MKTPRPRPVPPGSRSPKGSAYPQKNAGPLRTGALEAMKEHALRKAAQNSDMSYKRD